MSDLRETFVLSMKNTFFIRYFTSLAQLRLGQSESASDKHFKQSRR